LHVHLYFISRTRFNVHTKLSEIQKKKKIPKPNLNQEFVDSRQEVFSKKKKREEEAFGRRTFQHSLKKLPMLGYALLAIQGKVNAL
jgi:hypothetical protein